MKKFKIHLATALFLIPLFALAGYSPPKVQAALKKMYPTATDIAWSQNGNYYVADFPNNGFDTDVWLDANGNWIMTLTDLETTDELSPEVYNAFAMGDYAAAQVEDVTQATFPKHPTVFVIKVGQQNEDILYQLFYASNGALLRTYNMGYTEGTLTPETFECE